MSSSRYLFCPWCDASLMGMVYRLVEHCRNSHEDKLLTNELYHCPFCSQENDGSCEAYEEHLKSCVAFTAVMISGCSLRGVS